MTSQMVNFESFSRLNNVYADYNTVAELTRWSEMHKRIHLETEVDQIRGDGGVDAMGLDFYPVDKIVSEYRATTHADFYINLST